jgi:hypothetical protein
MPNFSFKIVILVFFIIDITVALQCNQIQSIVNSIASPDANIQTGGMVEKHVFGTKGYR